MTYDVVTPVYSGPLDILVQLVNRRHVDVMELDLGELVEEFSDLLAREATDLDTTSGFVLMSAILICLKARFLMPEPEAVDLEAEMEMLDQRDRLLARLLSFLTYRDVGAVLHGMMVAESGFGRRAVGIDLDLGERPPRVPAGITAESLASAMVSIALETSLPAPELTLEHLDLDLPSIEDAIDQVRRRLAAELESTFERLVAHCSGRDEVAAYFLAVLELVRWGLVVASQDRSEDILVRNTSPA